MNRSDDLQIMSETGLDREGLDAIRRCYQNAPASTPGYAAMIQRATGCSAQIVGALEDSMRNEIFNGGCLDSVSRRAFDKAAREAFAQYEYIMGKQIVGA